MTVVTRGDRELSLRFDQFPEKARTRIEARITALTDELEARVEAATPQGKTGKLRGEIKGRVFSGDQRVAGYVSVFDPHAGDYAKAATLEYGTDKPRRIFDKSKGGILARLDRKRRLVRAMSKPVHIEARMYLRDPLEEMRPEIEAALEEALLEDDAEATAA